MAIHRYKTFKEGYKFAIKDVEKWSDVFKSELEYESIDYFEIEDILRDFFDEFTEVISYEENDVFSTAIVQISKDTMNRSRKGKSFNGGHNGIWTDYFKNYDLSVLKNDFTAEYGDIYSQSSINQSLDNVKRCVSNEEGASYFLCIRIFLIHEISKVEEKLTKFIEESIIKRLDSLTNKDCLYNLVNSESRRVGETKSTSIIFFYIPIETPKEILNQPLKKDYY